MVTARGPGVLTPSPLPLWAVIKPETLQKATVELLDQGLCAGLYGSSLTDRMVCAGYLDGKVDSCQVSPGVPGGPQMTPHPRRPAGKGPPVSAPGPPSQRGVLTVSGPPLRMSPAWFLAQPWVSFFAVSVCARV